MGILSCFLNEGNSVMTMDTILATCCTLILCPNYRVSNLPDLLDMELGWDVRARTETLGKFPIVSV